MMVAVEPSRGSFFPYSVFLCFPNEFLKCLSLENTVLDSKTHLLAATAVPHGLAALLDSKTHLTGGIADGQDRYRATRAPGRCFLILRKLRLVRCSLNRDI